MATQKRRTSASKSAKSRMGRQALTAAAVGAAVGVATLAAAKGLKTPRGRALKKKAMTKGRKVLGDVKTAAVASAMANMKPAGSGPMAGAKTGTRSGSRSGTSSGTKGAGRKTSSRAR